ncbi:DUF5723 family protein [Mucilaginibacter sp. SP1R1]|uniref:DUF5723 family protein n=1 Tax=Mucilaginibacter sp. SP1R1 TaxID=2723091 RepID=UPI00161B421E|nr:DUF5723 family protein [Mucilaginibacter sp. SP1R1]MBB6148298.1 hypothetical protein [Mucilaginibacter sp. SP1R1]
MKKIFLLFLFFYVKASAQQFSLYNTETLYDSFENPAQRSFIPDSSRQFAFNFLVPNFDINTYLSGNIQPAIKTRLFANIPYYNTTALQIGMGKYNHFNANINTYFFMLKMFSSLNGDVEMGLSAQTKMESSGLFSDESLAMFSGPSNFPQNNYTNIFNDHYRFQSFHQLSFSYRERIDDKVAIGFKISGLLGIQHQKIDITESHLTLDKIHDQAILTLHGRYEDSYMPDDSYTPTLRNPGAAISLGASYTTDNNITIQTNIKDLGFILWNKRSTLYNFNNSGILHNISSAAREDTIYNGTRKILKNNGSANGFASTTNSQAEISATKTYWLREENGFKYIPTLLLAKELFSPGFTGVFINHFQYHNLTLSLTTSYNEMKFFNLGSQIMIKSPNAEFFIGSDRLLNTGKFAMAMLNTEQINNTGNYSGGDLFLGFSLKFGQVIDHPMNSSYIPIGGSDKGFFGRLFDRIF